MPRQNATVLYRPVGRDELEQIRQNGFRSFPPPPFGQPLFKPMLTREYAVQTAQDWSANEKSRAYSGYITEFRVDAAFLARYAVHQVGRPYQREYWIPVAELADFNRHIFGLITLIAEYHDVPDGAA